MIEDIKNFDILTTDSEKNERMSLCGVCVENKNINESPVCMQCACPIEYVVTYKFKACPLNKWLIV
jgi:hypothetical protein